MAGTMPVKRTRFVRPSGGSRTVNRPLEAKARALAGLKGNVTDLQACPDGTPITAEFMIDAPVVPEREELPDVHVRPAGPAGLPPHPRLDQGPADCVGQLVHNGRTPATAARALATLRSVLDFAVGDSRLTANVAAAVKVPRGGGQRREGHALTYEELHDLYQLCAGLPAEVPTRVTAAELVLVLGLTGMRWGELAGVQVGDLITVPGRGLRLQRTVLASNGGGELYVDTLKNPRSRTVPLVPELHPVIERRAKGRGATDWLFPAPAGGLLRESNWKRSVRWSDAVKQLGYPTLRVHDLRHTAASLWLASGADPKVVQAVLGHFSAAMTMDVYGHLIATNLWESATRPGGTTGARQPGDSHKEAGRGGQKKGG
jgi:integrase